RTRCFRVKIGEDLVLESIEITQSVQVVQVTLLGGLSATDTWIQLAEARVAYGRVSAQPASAVAVRTNVVRFWILDFGFWINTLFGGPCSVVSAIPCLGGRGRRTFPLCTFRDR